MTKLAIPFFAVLAVLRAQTDVMPSPASAVPGQGSLAITSHFRVALTGYDEPRLRGAMVRLIARLAKETGFSLDSEFLKDPSKATLEIHCGAASEPVQNLGEDESYRLEITGTRATLAAPNPLGILHGIETFLQLVEGSAGHFSVPAIVIDDHPRFPWRGLHLDVSRHWMPVEVVKRNLDGMAAVKLNVFHWHLTDDQGFRIESKRYPKLQELGSDNLFYTQEQVREVVAYAHDRGIRVVPEFDIPGHATSWLVGYPELASGPGPYEIVRQWGVLDAVIDPSREFTYKFLDDFIGEMAALFPDEYFHIGGDEVKGKQWDSNPQILAFSHANGLNDDHELQAYFNKRIQTIVKSHGKRMEGWDEILNADLPKDIVIQSWRGQNSLAKAAQLGYSGILSSGYYLDHIEPASKLYMVDPLGKECASLSEQEKARVLGGEVAMWAEYVSAENVDSRIWPRTAAIAERLWSPQNVTDIPSMYRRLDMMSRRLDSLGLTHNSSYRPMLQRLAGPDSIAPLKTLADVLEPGNLGQRQRTHRYTQQYPLNRLVDAVRPESVTAREFATLVDKMDRAQIRTWLILWRGNDAKLAPTIAKSALLQEDAPVSKMLSEVGAVGLQALSYLDKHQRPPEAWLTRQRAFLADAAKLKFELRLAIVPSIQKLLDAAAH